jgi:hypothetical protein
LCGVSTKSQLPKTFQEELGKLGVPLKAAVVVEYSGGRKMIVQQAVYRALYISLKQEVFSHR